MIGIPNYIQYYIFLRSLGAGYLIGTLFFFLSFIRIFIQHSKPAVFIEDIIFAVSSSYLTFLFLYTYNAGIPRFYILLGEATGIILCTVFSHVILSSLRNSVYKNKTRIANKRRKHKNKTCER